MKVHMINASRKFELTSLAGIVLKGQYEDTVCNGIPFSNGYFQKRTVYFGYPQDGVGTYNFEQDVFSDDSCSRDSRLYQYRMTGTYDLTGEKFTGVENFWDIDYLIQSATLRVLDMEFRDHLAVDTQCALDRLSLGRYYDVSDARCAALHIAPLDEVDTLSLIFQNLFLTDNL